MSEQADRVGGRDTSGPFEGAQAIFVGDVQGCADELEELIARIEGRFGDDFILYCVGDLINRGPANLKAMSLMRELIDAGQARYVLGNHELHLMMVALELREIGERDTFGDVLASSEREDWIDWLRARPITESGRVQETDFAVVHASVHPEWDFETLGREARRVERELSESADAARRLLAEPIGETDPGSTRDVLGRMLSCRSVKGDRWSSSVPNGEGVPWHEAWSKHEHDYGIVYGHWALQGLHVARGLRGLDTGCVHHGRGRDGFLTAWIPGLDERSGQASAFDVPDERFWQIPARRRYYDW